MTRNPVTITPKSRAIDALRAMSEGGFRHVPVTEDGTIKGVVSRGDLKGMEFEEFRWKFIGPARGSATSFREVAHIIEGQKPLLVARRRDGSACVPIHEETQERIHPRRRQPAALVGHIHRP